MKKSPAEKEQGQSVEDIFRNGFAEAESTPPSRIWENVNLELENQQLRRYRRQVIWYRSMAAAFLLLLVSGGIILWKQETVLVSQQEVKFATRQESTSSPVSPDLASKESATKPRATKEPFGKKTLEQLASVSRASSENQPENGNQASAENREQPSISYNRAENQPSPRNQVFPQLEKAQLERATQKEPSLVSNSSAASAQLPAVENTVANKEAVAEENVEGRAVVPVDPLGKTGDKPFNRAMLNSLAASKSLPSLLDSLPAVRQKNMLVQQEAENLAVAQAQPTGNAPESKTADVGKWSVTMAYSPQYAYAPVKIGNNAVLNERASLNQPQVYQQYQEAVQEFNSSYTPSYSYSALMGTSYRINEKWQLESGVLYTQNQATTTQSYLFYGGNMVGSSPLNQYADYSKSTPLVASAFVSEAAGQSIAVVPTDEYSTRYKYQQVGLPVRLAYRLNLKKVYALFSGGVNMNFLVQNAIVPQTNQVQAVKFGFNDKNSPFRAVQWATTTSVGLGYEVSHQMSILIAPEFTYSLSSMLREEQQQANTYQLGVSIGGRWRLTK